MNKYLIKIVRKPPLNFIHTYQFSVSPIPLPDIARQMITSL